MTHPQPKLRCTGCSRDYAQENLARCPYCLGFLFQLPVGWHGHEVTNKPRTPKVLRAQQLRAKRFRRRKAGPVLAAICGVAEVPSELTMVLSGAPAAGKSTTLVALLEDGTWASPLLCSSEEGLSVGVADRLARAEAVATSVTDAGSYAELVGLLESHGRGAFDCVAVDSLTSSGMRMEELLALRRAYGVSVIGVAQVLKDGRFAGRNTLMHDADVFVRIPEVNRFLVEKSWFSPCPNEGLRSARRSNMAKRKSDAPKIRRAIGPGFTSLLCVSCLNRTANGMVAVNGSPYVSCDTCRAKVFGLGPRGISGWRSITKLLEKPGMLDRLLHAQQDTNVVQPTPTPTPMPTPEAVPADVDPDLAPRWVPPCRINGGAAQEPIRIRQDDTQSMFRIPTFAGPSFDGEEAAGFRTGRLVRRGPLQRSGDFLGWKQHPRVTGGNNVDEDRTCGILATGTACP